MVNNCSRRGWKLRATRVTLVTSNVIQEIRAIRVTHETQGIPDMHRTTLRTQGMLTLARLPPRHRCLAPSATRSLAHNSQGSQTRRLFDPVQSAITNLSSPYGSAPSQYDQYGGIRRKYR
jgi:hypothetical protein